MTEEKLDSQSLISSLRSHFEITVVVAAQSESGRAGVAELLNNRFAIISDPLSYLYTSASPGKLIALHCRKAPVSKQPNSWRAKKCQMAKKKAECGLNLHHTYTKAEPVIALNVYHTCGNHF